MVEKTGKKELKETLLLPSINTGKYYIQITNENGKVTEELIIGTLK